MISVIIPSYNRARTIECSAKSVLNQTYKDIELIIVDDCSSDNTKEVVAELAKQDDRVRYVRHDKNQGACAARNTGINAAMGAYIAFQDSDDSWHPDKLERQLYVLEEKCADIVFCKYNRIKDGKFERIGPVRYEEGYLDPVINVMGIGTQTLLAKRSVFEEFHFDNEMPKFQELELLIRVTTKYKLYCLDIPLVEYNVGNADTISINPKKTYDAIYMILSKHPDIIDRMPDLGKAFAYELFKDLSYTGKKQGVRKIDVYKLICRCDRSWKCKVKVALRVLGLYDIVMSAWEKRKSE